ncbi:MAG: cupredoxin domain-containing protein [Chloroflexi bacterium]|nr:cupredoxin domain-containing protein [Chloroflexota bacterium]
MRTRFLIPALLLGLVACSSAAESDAPTSDATSTDAPSADALAVSVADFMIDPADLEVAGATVTIDVTNDGPTPHNLTIRDADGEVLLATADLGAGETETITGDLEAGDYTIFCSLAGHESLGMSGTLTVTAP